MNNFFIVSSLVLLFSTFGSNGYAGSMAEVRLINPNGESVGVGTFSETGEGVRVVVHVAGFEPGYHGLHIHEKGSCEPPGFKSAGGHFNPFGKEHGRINPKGTHAGDLPNLLVDSNGIGTAVVYAPLVTLKDGENSLLKSGGTALVIHIGADDNMSQPTGKAGGRAACGVIRKLAK